MLGAFRTAVAAALAALLMPVAAAGHPPDTLVGGAQVGPGEVAIVGILDGRRDRVKFDGLSVTINGASAEVSENGHFVANVPLASHYRVDISGERIFTTVQTFGNAELRDDSCQCLSIPAIEIVARKKGRVELFFAGDSMAGRRYFEPRKGERVLLRKASLDADLDALLSPMKPYIESADLASVNLETVLADEQPGPRLENKRIAFFSPTAYAHALKRAGVDYVTLGNNHIYDFGEAGVASTFAALESAGLTYSGAGHNDVQAERPIAIDLPKNPLSMLGFVGWEGSGGAHQTANATKGGAALGNRGQVRRSTKAVRSKKRIPIVQYHGGSEYSDRPSATTIGRLREAADRGSPLAIGHHPHLVQGVEIYRESLIAPSIGNFMFDQEFARTQVSYVIKAWLEKGKFMRAEIIPISVLDYRPVPAVGSAREASLRRLFALSAERGTEFTMSGGHAVVRPDGTNASASCEVTLSEFRLTDFAQTCAVTGMQRAGRNIIARGTFEQAKAFGAWERMFGTSAAGLDFAGAPGEEHALLRPEKPGRPVAFYTQGYLRDVPAGEYTLSAQIKLPRAARLEFRVKDRPAKGAKPEARWRGDVIKTIDLNASDEWQEVSVDFTRAAENADQARAFRPIIRIVWKDERKDASPVAIDDFALVSWFNDSSPANAWLATHHRDRGAEFAQSVAAE